MANTSKRQKDDFKQYLDIAGVMLLVLDSDQKVSLINKKGCEVLGYQENELIGKNWFDNFLPKKIADEVRAVFKRLMKGGDPGEYYENPILRCNGEEKIIYWHSSLLYDEHGSVKGVLSSGEDITEFRRIQSELKKRSDLMETMYKMSKELGSSSDLQDLLSKVGKILIEHSSILAGGIYLPSEKNQELLLKNSFGKESCFPLLPRTFPNPQGILRDSSVKNKISFEKISNPVEGINVPMRKCSLPMLVEDELMGLLMFVLNDEDGQTTDFLDLVSSETGRMIKRKKAELALKESEEKFYTVFQTSPDPIAISRIEDGTFLAVNEKFTELTGYTSDEAINTSIKQMDLWQNQQNRDVLLKKLKQDGKVSNYETVLRKKEGFFNALMSAKIIEYNGRSCMLVVVKDISDRIKAEQEILAAKEMLEKITATSPAFISLYDIKNDSTLYSNKSILRSVGYNDEDIMKIAATPTENRMYLYHPDDMGTILESDKKVLELKDGEVYKLEFRLRDTLGNYHWFRHSTAVYQRDENGIPVQSVNVFEDISEQKNTEEELRKVTQAIEQSPVTVMITDKNGYIEYVNPKFIELTGYNLA